MRMSYSAVLPAVYQGSKWNRREPPTGTAKRPARRATPAARPAPRPPAPASGYSMSRGLMRVVGDIEMPMANRLAMDLAACEGVAVEALVKSRGGSLQAGLVIGEALLKHGQVTATLFKADSAALAFCAARNVRAVQGSEYQLHDPLLVIPAAQAMSVGMMRDGADDAVANWRAFSRMFERRIRDSTFRQLAADNRLLSASEMVKWGLADSVIAASAPPASVDEEDDIEAEIAAGVAAALAQYRPRR